jgi:DNA-binding response OmpR family regulator
VRGTILIVDADSGHYLELQKRLLAGNHNVLCFHDIDGALDRLDLRAVDLLLLDLDIPSRQLKTALSRVAELNAGLRVFGLTARPEGSEIAVQAHLSGVAEKPIAIGELLTAIHALLNETSGLAEFRYVAPRLPGFRHRVFGQGERGGGEQ